MTNEHCPLPESEWEKPELEPQGTPEPPPDWTKPHLIARAFDELVSDIVSSKSPERQRELSRELDDLRRVEQETAPYWKALLKREQRVRKAAGMDEEEKSKPEPEAPAKSSAENQQITPPLVLLRRVDRGSG